jgi:hypothetical protein
MAKVKLNPIAASMKGKIGGAVLRQCHTGELQFISAPDMSRVKWSEAQKEHRRAMKIAVIYAKEAMKRPELRAYYVEMAVKKNKNPRRPFDMAVSDYYHGNDLLWRNNLRPEGFHAEAQQKPYEPTSQRVPTADSAVAHTIRPPFSDDLCI